MANLLEQTFSIAFDSTNRSWLEYLNLDGIIRIMKLKLRAKTRKKEVQELLNFSCDRFYNILKCIKFQ